MILLRKVKFFIPFFQIIPEPACPKLMAVVYAGRRVGSRHLRGRVAKPSRSDTASHSSAHEYLAARGAHIDAGRRRCNHPSPFERVDGRVVGFAVGRQRSDARVGGRIIEKRS